MVGLHTVKFGGAWFDRVRIIWLALVWRSTAGFCVVRSAAGYMDRQVLPRPGVVRYGLLRFGMDFEVRNEIERSRNP